MSFFACCPKSDIKEKASKQSTMTPASIVVFASLGKRQVILSPEPEELPSKYLTNYTLITDNHFIASACTHAIYWDRTSPVDPVSDPSRLYVVAGDSAVLYNHFLPRAGEVRIILSSKTPPTVSSTETLTSSTEVFPPFQGFELSKESSPNFLIYRKTKAQHGEHSYLNLLRDIINEGHYRKERTGTGAFSVFGRQMRFDISESVPLLTTKFVGYRSVLLELLWFLQGNTNSKALEEKGVTIWRPNTSREFLDRIGRTDCAEGDCGPMYGFQWLHWGAAYNGCNENYDGQGINQLDEVLELLKNDPFSRRIIMTTYNVADRHKGVLYPCHGLLVQFFVTEKKNDRGDIERHLSCHMTQRSWDTFLGAAYNIFSYAALTYLIAAKVGMKPCELIISSGDTHLYSNHIEQAQLQLTRTPYPFPRLVVNPEVASKDWKEIAVEDFTLVGYLYHPSIKADMSA